MELKEIMTVISEYFNNNISNISIDDEKEKARAILYGIVGLNVELFGVNQCWTQIAYSLFFNGNPVMINRNKKMLGCEMSCQSIIKDCGYLKKACFDRLPDKYLDAYEASTKNVK